MWLVIVRREGDKWVIDEDSAHIFEDEGGNYPIQEIQVAQIRAVEISDIPSS